MDNSYPKLLGTRTVSLQDTKKWRQNRNDQQEKICLGMMAMQFAVQY